MKKEEQLRRWIIEALHDLPYEEAIKDEFMDGCKYTRYGLHDSHRDLMAEKKIIRTVGKDEYKYLWDLGGSLAVRRSKESKDGLYIQKIIGLPITLGRVIQALENRFKNENEKDPHQFTEQGTVNWRINKILSIWKRVNDDKSDCNLEDQSKETKAALYELFKK
jgi:hypothetical protein